MLATALQTARSGLSAATEQIDVLSRNVSRVGDPNATRKIAVLETGLSGIVTVSRIDRTANQELLDASLAATSSESQQQVVDTALARLQSAIGEVTDNRSPAALIGRLGAALQTYAANPADAPSARAVVAVASSLCNGINDAANAVQKVRSDADAEIHRSVDQINALLGKLQTLNKKVVSGTRESADVADVLDERDNVVRQISQEIGVRVVGRPDGDIALFTDSGVTLFNQSARSIQAQSGALAAGVPGGAVVIDGVVAAGSGATMAVTSGRLRGLVDTRDSTTEIFGAQLDEIARGLVAGFAEKDQTPGAQGADVAGLFAVRGSSAIPQAGIRSPGLATQLTVNPAVDPTQGGVVTLIRDGGVGGAAYVANKTGSAGFSDRIDQLSKGLDAVQAFSTATQLGPNASLKSLSTDSVAWLAQERQVSSGALQYQAALKTRATDAWSRDTGISLDQEMSSMLELERSYQASARMLTTIDEMYRVLLNPAA